MKGVPQTQLVPVVPQFPMGLSTPRVLTFCVWRRKHKPV